MHNAPQNRSVPDVSGTCAGFCAVKNGKKPNEINHVPDVPDKSPTFPCVCVCAHARTHAKKRALVRVSVRHTRHIRHIFDLYGYFGKLSGTSSGTPSSNPAQAKNPGESA
jgi:hypothetical protein